MRMTFEEYDQMIERFNSMEVRPCWPSEKLFDIEINKNPEKYIRACCYLLEKGKTTTLKEEYIRSLINEFVKKNLELYDPEEDAEIEDNPKYFKIKNDPKGVGKRC